MAQPMPSFIFEDGTLREFTPEDLERLTETVDRVLARMCAAGAAFSTSNVDEVS
ncbi:hypothetical protein M2271_003524 [Streptomyces sp. LBL]|uniref:hypothetical protein n=1 Tax=Streptomyces sp. LBL TaxID=2940562 RepID=UPI002475AB21|nr:hypothetical protein [Streptomyces sp. LBL]MDH6625713.1 hypothetical protein [Streptomyces sp. LBL]